MSDLTSPATRPLRSLSRSELSVVARELMLAGHLHDRASVPAILGAHPMEDAIDIAIEEWMTASPVYTQRMQRLLRFEGDDVATIFKGIQLDIGMPHQFLDAGYAVHDAHHGEFWLRSCGALADARPMGEGMVRGMCHDIEDPTFDATAVATNPRARMTPIHRPPEIPHGGPDCHWEVTIDPALPAIQPHPRLADVAQSLLAKVPNAVPPNAEPGGWDDYDRPLDPHFELEDLSHGALVAVCREFAIQAHLLSRALLASIDRRFGRDEAIEVGRTMFTGIGWVAAERLAAALRVEPGDPDGLARVLPLVHLCLPSDYLGLTISAPGPGTTLVTLAGDAPALREGDPFSLAGLLQLGADEILASIVQGIDPRAQVQASATGGDGRAWAITTAPGAAPVSEPPSASIVRFSTGTKAVFIRRRPLRT